MEEKDRCRCGNLKGKLAKRCKACFGKGKYAGLTHRKRWETMSKNMSKEEREIRRKKNLEYYHKNKEEINQRRRMGSESNENTHKTVSAKSEGKR